MTYTVGGAGRPTAVTDSSNTFATSVSYAPHGALTGMSSGTGPIVTNNIFNNRLQPTLLSAGVGQSADFSICYDFHSRIAINVTSQNTNQNCSFNGYTTGNNGNVFQVLNKVDPTRNAAFAYDLLNRITQANTITTTGSNCWGEQYTIDNWGNLTNVAGVPSMGGCLTETLNAAPASTHNQLSGYCHDAAGNLLLVGTCPSGTITPTWSYDLENRLSSTAGYTYYYDADGVRMEKLSGSTGTMYWPGPNGEYLSETDANGNINEEYVYFNGGRLARVDRPSGTVHYYFSDELGSTGVIAAPNGQVQEQYFYYPYGGLVASIGSDPNHYKFNGKERDAESNLDEFGARYYTSTMGRFMTPDWAAKPTAVPYAHYGNPQSLNLYSFVQNNPATFGDPDGHCLEDACVIEGGIVVTAMVASYLSTPQGQQMLRNATRGAINAPEQLGHWIGGLFRPDDGGRNTSPPPSVSTNAPSQSPPPSTSQQGLVDHGPISFTSVPLPSGLVGTQDKDAGQQGGRHNSGPLDPAHGGTGDAGRDFDILTGGKSGPAPSTYPAGTRQGDNGITLRPPKAGSGPRIDIPANGVKPHETLHYPLPKAATTCANGGNNCVI